MSKLDCPDSSARAGSAIQPDRVIVEPSILTWSVEYLQGCDQQQHRQDLVKRVNRRADRLGTAKLRCDKPIIITGHQCGLWHPGILIKDFAASQAAEQLNAQWLHLVVDQDAHDSSVLDWPVLRGDVLETHKLVLWEDDASVRGVPTVACPAVTVEDVVQRIQDFARQHGMHGAIDCFASAWQRAGEVACQTLAEQWAVVTASMLEPWCGDVAMLHVSDLEGWEPYERSLLNLIEDATTSIKRYNDAVQSHPSAGLAMLQVGREHVELPLWAIREGEPRRRVWADSSDTTAAMVLDDGREVDRSQWSILPRALMLTASLRTAGQGCCDVFIHGTGGGAYDEVMEQWLRSWVSDLTMSPKAVVTADVRLNWSGVAKAGSACLRRAQWRVHHLPHNMDRELELKGPRIDEKRHILLHMDDDRDRQRRATLFRRLHEINRTLALEHRDILEDAQEEVRRCQRGLANRQAAMRRDWPWLAYEVQQIAGLYEALKV